MEHIREKDSQSIFQMIKDNPFQPMLLGKIIPAQCILVLAPHCDDEVLGCGGTMLQYLEKGRRIVILYLTLDQEQKRKTEALNAWQSNDNIVQEFLGMEDSKLSSFENEVTGKINELIFKYQPEVIFTPWFFDMHDDHRASSIFLAQTLRTLINTDHPTPHYVASYEVNFPLYINYSINITKSMDQKLAILKQYVSQNPDQLGKVITNLNQYRAEQIGLRQIRWAEAFNVCAPEIFCSLVAKFL